jgi:CheY-like chemotaxis protein
MTMREILMRPNHHGGTVEILLVEDNPGDVRLTEEAFKEAEVSNRMTVARDGVQALAMLRNAGREDAPPLPDIILLDLNLPRMDGRELLAEIKADPDLRHIPIVVLTTSNAPADIRKAYGLNANCFVTKPVDLDDFMDVVRAIEAFWLTVVTLPSQAVE